LINGAALKRVKTDLMGEAEQRFHGGDVGVEGRRTTRGAVPLHTHRFERGLHVLHGGAFEARPGSREGFDEAATDALLGATRVARAVRVRLEPDREQVEVSRRVGVNLGQSLGTVSAAN
jgi:hypothetical protein